MWRSASTPSSFPARRSPRRARRTCAPGSIGCVLRRCTARSCAWTTSSCARLPARKRPRRPIDCAGRRCRCLRRASISSMGSRRYATCGESRAQHGAGIHAYCANRSMDRVFYNADGEMLFVPQEGAITLATELGRIAVAPGEIALVPRGVKFRVEIHRLAGARLHLRELRRDVPPARSRSHRLQRSRQRARFPVSRRRVRGSRRAYGSHRQVRRPPVERDVRSLAARRGRLARQLRALQVRPRALQHHEHGELRPRGSVDLHGAHLAIRYARHCERGLRDLPAAMDWSPSTRSARRTSIATR